MPTMGKKTHRNAKMGLFRILDYIFLQYNSSAHEPLEAINAHILSPVID
jgi:hypothetical protein